MSIGFGKVKAKRNKQLIVKSMVKTSNLDPAVAIKWGNYEGIMTPDEAIAHAMNVLEAASAARSDSAVTKLFSKMEGLDIPKAIYFRGLLREFRKSNQEQDMSNVRVILDPEEEPVPVPDLKEYAGYLLEMATATEVEAFLVEYLRQYLSLDDNRINQILGELRAIMFPKKEE